MTRRTRLLATVGAGALTAATAASQAMAFDVVDWDWTKTVTSLETITVTTNVTINFNGLVELEKWQLSFGDIKSSSIVKDVANNPPDQAGFTGPINQTFTFSPVFYDPSTGLFPCTAQNVINCTLTDQNGTTNGTLTATLLSTPPGPGVVTENANSLAFSIRVTGDPSLATALDAVDLPGIVNASTAVANNQTITTTTALQLHDLQIAAGDINSLDGREYGDPNALAFVLGALGIFQIDNQLGGINEQYDMAALTILGAATGFIDEAHIRSFAGVFDITNAFVDNSSTAVGNNAAFTINASIPGNAYFIGDVTQLLIGDVTSKAKVADVTINNYTGFGAAGFGLQSDGSFTPIVKNVSTAVGNNLVINVDGCTLCTPVVGGGT